MGNAAAKAEWSSAELSDGIKINENEALSILPSLVTKEATRMESKGKNWIVSETDALLWSAKQVGMIKSHSLIRDKHGNTFATIIIEKTGMNSLNQYICKSTPSFEGQESLSDEDLKKAGIEKGTVLYPFSQISTVRKMTTATSTYSIVTGKDGNKFNFQLLYRGEKLPSMGLMAIMREGDTPVAKAQTMGMKMKPVLEAATGVDPLALVLMGYSLAGGGGSAGALAGAGVV